ncbi:MAG: phospholipid carrier-dependent glycosyltransferase [Candidatus Saccharibacteria bacterium]|nr:phospholipid carrier-dependent glycosyltransferase [Candidatus Saccharibacteria bacterium]
MKSKWQRRLFRYPEIWVLCALALLTRLWQLDFPRAIVFDEVYFRQFASDYLNGHFFFDIHPPLVKLVFAGIGALFHLGASGVADGDPGGWILRALPALAGAALVPLMYVIIRQLGLGRRMAAFGALLVLCDNALLVESRFVLMDSLLLLAGMGALSSYLQLRRTKKGLYRWLWVIATAVLLGTLVSTKWTGLAIAGLIFFTWIIDGVLRKIQWQQLIAEGAAALAIIATIYIGCFAVHFALLTHSGDGDAFMSQKFQSTLVGNENYKASAKMSLWDKIVEYNAEMYSAQNSLESVTHPYASRWYSWPFETRSVYFWQGEAQKDGSQGNIYLLGNPAVWWLSAVGMFTALGVWLLKPAWLGKRRRLVAFLLTGYALNFVPFTFITRPMFLYHYLFALLFSMLVTVVMLSLLFTWQREKYGRRAVTQTYWALVVIIVLGFINFIPLSYGWPMTPDDLQMHMWLPSWR